jgi:predicted DNA-binding protein
MYGNEKSMTTKISISLPDEIAEKIEEIAEETGQPTSQIVQKALQNYLQSIKSEGLESEEPELWEEKIQKEIQKLQSGQKQILSKFGLVEGEAEETKKEKAEEGAAIEELFERCKSLDDFLDEVESRHWIGNFWTDEKLEKCAGGLRDLLKKSEDDWDLFVEEESFEALEKAFKVMKLSQAQKKTFREAFESPNETAEEEDEWL